MNITVGDLIDIVEAAKQELEEKGVDPYDVDVLVSASNLPAVDIGLNEYPQEGKFIMWVFEED